MRIRVTLQIDRETMLPLNYQHCLTAAVYNFLEQSDADYARFLHEEGYAAPAAQQSTPQLTARRFKLFTFSQLRAERSHLDRRQAEPRLRVLPGSATWFVTSPVEQFIKEFATGLLSAGVLRVGPACLPIGQVETLPSPDFKTPMRFRCLSPIVAAVSEESEGRRMTRYLRPKDPGWSERLRHNLLGKYDAVHGFAPEDDHLAIAWDADYLARHKGTKLVRYKEIDIVGVMAPFELAGSSELIRLGYEAGLGEKGSAGFGMIEEVER